MFNFTILSQELTVRVYSWVENPNIPRGFTSKWKFHRRPSNLSRTVCRDKSNNRWLWPILIGSILFLVIRIAPWVCITPSDRVVESLLIAKCFLFDSEFGIKDSRSYSLGSYRQRIFVIGGLENWWL